MNFLSCLVKNNHKNFIIIYVNISKNHKKNPDLILIITFARLFPLKKLKLILGYAYGEN